MTLVFPQGIEMRDPAGLLKGAGKVMRHIRIESVDEVKRPEIAALLSQARMLSGLSRRTKGGSLEVITTFKAASRRGKPRAAKSAWPDRLF